MKTATPQQMREFQEKFIAQIAPGSHFHVALNHLANVRTFVKDTASCFVWVSDNVPCCHGLADPADMVGLDDFALSPPRLARKYRRDDRHVIRSGRPLLGLLELVSDERRMFNWFVTNKLPLRSADDRVIGLVVTIEKFPGVRQLPVFDAEVRAAIDYIFGHVGQRLHVLELAGVAGVSPRQIERRFRNAVGMSPTDFMIRARLEEACRQLREGGKSIGQIALDLGFYDQSALTRQFRRLLGTTPLEFQRAKPWPCRG